MAFTRHGHQIIGTIAEERPDNMSVMRCGGPGICHECSIDASAVRVRVNPYGSVDDQNEPTEPGFYKYSGGNQKLIFLLYINGIHPGEPNLQWYVTFDNATFHECSWAYISQALGVWKLEKIK